MRRFVPFTLFSLIALRFACAQHKPHEQVPVFADDDWETVHMKGTSLVSFHSLLQPTTLSSPHPRHGSCPTDSYSHAAEEHHISSFDPASFFNLHDYDSSNSWTPDEIKRMYGLMDESAREVSEEKKHEVVQKVLEIYDKDRSGDVSFAEFVIGSQLGRKLPDFGLGPGHHGDDEYEYEIHHFEKYHDENTREEDLTHPEDIAHFKKHEEEEEAAEQQEKLDRMPIVDENIPGMFRRHD